MTDLSFPLTAIPELGLEETRVATLREYSILDTEHEPAFDGLAQLAGELFDVPMAFVTFLDESRVWMKSAYGFDIQQILRSEINGCNYVIKSDEVFAVEDMSTHPELCMSPFVSGPPGLRFYAGAPLITANGSRIGTICIVDVVPRPVFTLKDRKLLQSIAAAVVAQLELRSRSRELDALAEKHRLIASAVAQTGSSILITDSELDHPGPAIIYVNDAFCAMTGYTREEVLGQNPRVLQGVQTERAVLERLRNDLKAGRTFEGETINYRKNGTPFRIRWKVSPVHDTQGRLTNFISTQQDVSAEFAAAQETAEIASRLNSIDKRGPPLLCTIHFGIPVVPEE